MIVDENGDYSVGVDEDSATEWYDENIVGGIARRHIVVQLTAALPETIELKAQAFREDDRASAAAEVR